MKIKSNSNDKTYDVAAAGICLVVYDFLGQSHQECGKILLYKRHGDGADGNHSASFPCGGMEPGETLYQAAARELYEECMPTDQRLTINKAKFVEVFTDHLNRKPRLKSVFFGIEPVENQAVGMIGLMVDRHSDLFKDYLSKLGSSQRLEDYADGSGVSEGVPFWVDTRSDWAVMLEASTYGVYNQAFLYCTYFLNLAIYTRLHSGLPFTDINGFGFDLEMDVAQFKPKVTSSAVYDVFKPFYREGCDSVVLWRPYFGDSTSTSEIYFLETNYEIV